MFGIFHGVILSVLGLSLGVCSHGLGSNKLGIMLGPFQGVIMISVLGPSLGVCSHGPGSKQAWKGQVSTHRPNIFPKSQRNGKHYFS